MDLHFLTDLTQAVVEACRVPPDRTSEGIPPNVTGGTLLQPSGRCSYPAFWLRDHALSVASGCISLEEQRHAILLAARTQQARDWHTPSGSFVPKGSIADHISFSGEAVFFPGTLDAQMQSSAWGTLPSADDHFLLIEMVWEYCNRSADRSILSEVVAGEPLIERLELAFSVPKVSVENGLVRCTEEERAASFGFCDAVVHTGELLFASLLRRRGAILLAELTGNEAYSTIAARIEATLPDTFAHAGGLLRACTGVSQQPDVFGSAYAVYTGAVKGALRERICERLCDAYRTGTLAYRGAVRSVLTSDDFSTETAWERTVGPLPLNEYQNGAYWMPTVGWVCFAMAQVDELAARRLAEEYVSELKATNFRTDAASGAPYECLHPERNYRQTPVCITAVTLPLTAFRRLGWGAA